MIINLKSVPTKNYGEYTSLNQAEDMRKWCEVDQGSNFSIGTFNNKFYIVQSRI